MLCTGIVSEFHAEASQATASEGLAQGPYVAARVGLEPAPLRTKGDEPTNKPPLPDHVILCYVMLCSVMFYTEFIWQAPPPSERRRSQPLTTARPSLSSSSSNNNIIITIIVIVINLIVVIIVVVISCSNCNCNCLFDLRATTCMTSDCDAAMPWRAATASPRASLLLEHGQPHHKHLLPSSAAAAAVAPHHHRRQHVLWPLHHDTSRAISG